ncbi:MAG: hypothetical protein K8I60_08335 [Anaerolineae bacterium]|nr:hypothetical protein [Anaerolineae bacterium]
MSVLHSTDSVPQPRAGLLGSWDRFIGPGATTAENILILGVPLVAAALLLIYAASKPLAWTPLQTFLAALLALDMTGGVVTNAATAAKRWYHRPGQTARHHLGFVSVHAAQLLIVSLAFRDADWGYFVLTYGYLMVASFIIVNMPLYLQRPVSLLAYMLVVGLGGYLLTPTPGMEWFLPVFYLKLLVSHLPYETPFKPRETR